MISKNDWKLIEAPKLFKKFDNPRILNDDDSEKLISGFKPRDMDDRWFVYSENGWVYFHRSWTGHLIFWIKLDGCPAGVRITDVYVNNDLKQYRSSGDEGDLNLLNSIIDRCIQS